MRFYENGRQRRRSYASREIAERVLAKILGAIAVDEAGLPPDPKGIPTLADLFKPWLERRKHTHRSWMDDQSRWNAHVREAFGKLRPAEVTQDGIARFVDDKLQSGLASTSVGHLVRLLSTFMSDVVEDPRNGIAVNPCRLIRRAVRQRYRNRKVDPLYLALADVRRVFVQLQEPYATMFAVGVGLGLRTGEVMGLMWEDLDLERRRARISRQVNDGVITVLKDADPRSLPISDSLLPVLKAWKLAVCRHTGGAGLMFHPSVPGRGGRPDLGRGHKSTFVRLGTLNKNLKAALLALGLPGMGWKHATRVTFATNFVLGGGSLEVLQGLLGHSSLNVTMKYARHRVDLFPESAYQSLPVDFSDSQPAKVLAGTFPGAIESKLSPDTEVMPPATRRNRPR